MANKILFISSIILINSDSLLYRLAVLSSILNHGLTSNIIKWIDRLIIILCILISPVSIFIFLSVFCYILSKKINNCIPHVLSHLFLAINVYNLYNNNK